jgi:uncharacterized protein (TIGR03118 family)
MISIRISHKTLIFTLIVSLSALAIAIADPQADSQERNNRRRPAPIPSVFDWENLQSDIPGVGELTDPNLINPWGLAISPFGNIWVADNGAGVATVYFQNGQPFPNQNNPLVVTIPASAMNTDGANPTGIVLNTTQFFKISNGTNSLPAQFIFVSEDGMIFGWNQQLSTTQAFAAHDNGATGAVYKAVTKGTANGHDFIYVTNFHSGAVETYDENFVLQAGFPFSDPNLPAGFAPFGIRNLNGQIFVTYAKQDNPADAHDDVPGLGNGFIDIFTTSGTFAQRLVSNGALNSPWGLEIINGTLWVGNFGDGHINIYRPGNGNFLGTPQDTFGNSLQFQGLWSLVFGNQGLFFTAGIVDEDHGIFGVIFPGF